MITSCYAIHNLFNIAQLYPQKVALVLDDQVWTYSELIMQIKRVVYQLHHLGVVQGQIIYQFVERSFEMICGFFGIMYIGGVYCPLNPTLPPSRLNIILEQMQGQYVLVHEKTLNQFPIAAVQHVIVLDNILLPLLDIKGTDDLPISREYDAAFIILTSGTTGQPKAVVHTHKSFSAIIAAFIQWNVGIYTARDHVLQVAASSWITHTWEISAPLVVGGTLVLLRQGGHLDVAYFSQTLMRQQITTLIAGSAIIRALTNYIENNQQTKTFDTVRYLCTGGEALKPKQWTQFVNLLSSSNVQLCVIYGLSESGGVLGCRLLNIKDTDIPIGYLFPTIRCLLIDDDGKTITTTDNLSEIGQIHLGGPTLFNGYLNDPELTANKFTTINNEVYFKTGDLARYNAQGKLFYVGRADFQIKIRGQRVETTEIENTITNSYPDKISDCVVTKLAQNDDLLVAYVVSKESELDTEQIRNYCNRHLHQYMIPSIFVFLKQLPLNANGKLDRQRLPTPDISVLLTDTNDPQYLEPKNELETVVHSLWCELFDCNRISTMTNFFNIGGHSLLLIQLYQNYKMTLNIDTTKINISELFQHTTIADHVRLIHQSIDNTETYQKLLSSVHNMQEKLIRKRACSISQENIILIVDELSRYESFPVTDIQLAYLVGREGVIDLGHVSAFIYREYDFSSTFDTECFERALNYLIQRHEGLRLIFPSHTEQKILKTVPYYTVSVLNLDDVQSSQKHLIERREQLSHQVRPADQWPLFDFQITRYICKDGYKIRLHFGFDALILDFWSINLILHELNQLYYNLDDILVELKLSYRDYILAEQQWKQTAIYSNDRQYW
ncbi:unnamed protein product, partial [Adineta steineri]